MLHLQREGNTMKNWKTTAAGILSALIGISGPVAVFLASLQQLKALPDYTLAIITACSTLIFSVARIWVGILMHDPIESSTAASPSATKVIAPLLLLALLVLPMTVYAQTAPPAGGTTFTASSQAVGVYIGGNWGVGTDIGEQLQVTNTVYVAGDELLATSISFTGYYGGLGWTPDISKLIAKTKLPANTFQPFVHAGAGVATNSDVKTNGTHPSFFAGGGINYSPTKNGAFTLQPVRIDYLNAPGFGTSPHGWTIAAGMSYLFGK